MCWRIGPGTAAKLGALGGVGYFRLQRAQPDDDARHAGHRPDPLIRAARRETQSAIYSCTKAHECNRDERRQGAEDDHDEGIIPNHGYGPFLAEMGSGRCAARYGSQKRPPVLSGTRGHRSGATLARV